MPGILSVGVSGITAAQVGLQTTEHNITNANTAGYNRQTIVQATNEALSSGAGFIGQGTQVTSVARVYNSFINDQINLASTNASSLGTYYDQVSQIDNLLADTKAGLSPALQDFFTAVQQVSSNPTLISARQSLMSSAQALTARFQTLDKRLSDMYDGVNQQLTSTVSQINSLSSQIADINNRIVVAQGSTSQPPNDLLDQRDQLIADLNKLVRTTTATEKDGSVSVFIGNGQQLVVGQTSNQLTATPSNSDPERIAVGLKTASGSTELPEGLVTGGVLGGLLQFRSQSLDVAVDSLGQVAGSLAETFNAQHALGQDLLGNKQGDTNFMADFFQFSSAKVIPAGTNKATGSLAVTLNPATYSNGNFTTDFTNSTYKVVYDGSNYTLTRTADGKSWGPADLATLNTQMGAQGFQFDTTAALPSNLSAGDSFMIEPTRNLAKNLTVNGAIAADPRLFAAASPILATTNSANLGTATASVGSVAPGYTLPALGTPDVLTYSGGTLTAPDGTSVAYSPQGTTITYNGITVTVSGIPQDGDTFQVAQNTSGVGDSRNAVLLGKLQTANTTIGGTATYQGTYAQLVSNIGNKTREVKVMSDSQQALVTQATDTRNSSSGVNLDEEAANLIKYQTAYQASARMISIASKLFDTLVSIGQ